MIRSLLAFLLGAVLWFSAASAQTIIGTLPFTLQNGSVADANQVMSDFNTIVAAVNANAANAGANSNITALNGLTTPLSYTAGGTSNYIGGTSSGSANAQVIASPIPSGFTLVTGKSITFIAGFTNTGPTQLNVAGTGLTNVFRQTATGIGAMVGGEIVAGQVYTAVFDGTQFQLQGPSPQGLVPPCTVIDWVGAGAASNAGPSGYLVMAGQAVSRTTFASLFACIAVSGVAATTSNGSTSVVVPNSGLFSVGWFVGGNNVTCNSTITAIPDGTHITISAGAGASGATTLTIGPYQQGDCSTTFNIGNFLGRFTAMFDGGSVITAATCANPSSVGSFCGQQTQTLTLAQLPTGITGTTSGSLSVSVSSTVSNVAQGTLTNINSPGGGPTNYGFVGSPTTTAITSTGNTSGSLSVTSNNTSGAAHPILPPVALVAKYIKF
jgi:hypothetical protein